jgi:hypothetical protein
VEKVRTSTARKPVRFDDIERSPTFSQNVSGEFMYETAFLMYKLIMERALCAKELLWNTAIKRSFSFFLEPSTLCVRECART